MGSFQHTFCSPISCFSVNLQNCCCQEGLGVCCLPLPGGTDCGWLGRSPSAIFREGVFSFSIPKDPLAICCHVCPWLLPSPWAAVSPLSASWLWAQGHLLLSSPPVPMLSSVSVFPQILSLPLVGLYLLPPLNLSALHPSTLTRVGFVLMLSLPSSSHFWSALMLCLYLQSP